MEVDTIAFTVAWAIFKTKRGYFIQSGASAHKDHYGTSNVMVKKTVYGFEAYVPKVSFDSIADISDLSDYGQEATVETMFPVVVSDEMLS